jgi:hypothetical protein
MLNRRLIWVIAASGVVLSGAAIVTLRAAEQATRQPATTNAAGRAEPAAALATARAANTLATPGAAAAAGHAADAPATGDTVHPPTAPAHPAPSAPEESATIVDDPTTAPDPSQSADNNVSFPNDI